MWYKTTNLKYVCTFKNISLKQLLQVYKAISNLIPDLKFALVIFLGIYCLKNAL